MDELLVTTNHDAVATASWQNDSAEAVASASRARHVASSLSMLLAVAFGGLSVAVVAQLSIEPATYASTSTTTAILDLAAGLGMMAVGCIWWHKQGRGSVGPITTLIGVTWLSADWIAWPDGSDLVRSIAMVAGPFLLPLVVHVSVAFPTGRVTDRLQRAIVAAAYGATAAISFGWALLRDPFRDRYCWSNCTVNSFLVHANPSLSRSLSTLWPRFALSAGVVVAATCIWRLGRVSRVGRRSFLPVLGALVAVGLSQVFYAAALMADPAEDPERRAFRALFDARAAAFVALAAGILLTVLREIRTRRSVARLADELGAASPVGSLATVLGRSLGDAQLDVVYWLPGPRVYVDASGHRVDPLPGPTQTVTPIERNGRPIALVTHDRTLLARHDLEREIGAAARLAVDNERLRAQALAQLFDLRASRSRIVEASDASRRQLEHNLHDGAQQRLLALSYELRLAECDARAAGDTRLAGVLAAAGDKAGIALVELRDLAHGIFPVILTEAGLGPALETFIDTAPIGVELVDVPDRRFPDDVEIAVYILVTSVVDAAVRRRGSRVVVTFTLIDSEFGVVLVDDGIAGTPDDETHIRDRVGALGGRLDVVGTRVQAVIPCA
ncbi:MAG TPA: hypothetical protein VNB52_01935 [Ilumatobacteraceae bacterium]|nr:hypothetical protein [Ilumatobacteraceae bacterium]